MKKMFSMPVSMAQQLEKIAKQNNITQSAIVVSALTIYMMMYKFSPTESKKLDDLIPKDQVKWAELDNLLNSLNKG
jgi:hypothetical protein